jgi:GT2 family glycosyltransferase/spore maturation protein CgeB
VTTDDQHRELAQEVDRLRQMVADERGHAEQWREVAEERRVQLERLRQHPVIAVVFRVAQVVLPILRRLQRRVLRWSEISRRALHGLRRLPEQLGAPRRQRRLARQVAALPPAPPLDTSVTIIILTRDGRENLARLLPALHDTVPAAVEVVVVDNDSAPETADWLDQQPGVRVVRNDRNLSFSEANERGVAVARGDVLCFLNDDVEPLRPGWLERMVHALVTGDNVVAVGAQLVYPRRAWGRSRTRDLGVQHVGIGFEARPGDLPRATNLGHGDDPDVTTEPRPVAAVTAACLVVSAAVHRDVGGFDPRYQYGAEDVDLCWRLRQGGGSVVVAPDAVLYHHEGATRHREPSDVLRRRQQRNWDLLAQRFGPAMDRAVTVERLQGERVLTSDPYRVGITVTRDLPEAGYGDWYTAHELGHELERLGWQVSYLERYQDAWYDVDPTLDAVVVLLDLYDLRRVARPGLTTIAWVRNWADRWASHPWFDDYDMVLTSSATSAARVASQSRHEPVVFPLATNPDRFPHGTGTRSDAVFTGNNWGVDRQIGELVEAVPELRVYGKGWDDDASLDGHREGHVSYDQLPAIYAGAVLVVDQAADHTRGEGSLNSRVFDALAAGALPVTNQVDGAVELFGELLPTYHDRAELEQVARRWLDNPVQAAARAADLRQLVLADHTYATRARQLQTLLIARAQRPSIVLATSAPDLHAAPSWGDWHLALALERELRALGHVVETITADRWDDRSIRRHDILVHLRGRSRVSVAPGQFHVVWNISHPEELTPEECDEADLVLVASHTGFERELAARTSTPVEVLLQATDERRFRPRPPQPRLAAPVAFVGNSRFVFRPAVRDALDAGFEFDLYGANWEKFLDPSIVRATHVPNDELPALYSSVDVLLNDHWDAMRQHGFASNRLFDALACGTVVVSDAMPGLDELFDGGVVTYRDANDLTQIVAELGRDEDQRHRRGAAGRAAVLARHTFRHRAAELLDAVERHRVPSSDVGGPRS